MYSINTRLIQVNAKMERYDPTRTTHLRNLFCREMRKRFRAIRVAIRKKIVDDDCFGLKKQPITVHAGEFKFPTTKAKIEAFLRWLRELVDTEALEIQYLPQVGGPIEVAWTNAYITESYRRGLARARYELGKSGYGVPSLAATGGIDAAFGTPFHMDRVGVLYTRTFNDLKGITAAMDAQISRVLAQGMIDGDNPRRIAKMLGAVISGGGEDLSIFDILGRFIPAERRAMTLARTEIIRAHHLATVQEYQNWGVAGVTVKAELKTAGDSRVCDKCAELEGNVYTLEEIASVIPVHPNCRCCVLPVDMTGKDR